jgi:hypothetical protein
MAPDQCIFVSATYDMTYEKEVIFGSQIYRVGVFVQHYFLLK